jgi:hypothetical protein
MKAQRTARNPLSCYVCSNNTEERCSYCLLPLCSEHGEHIQPWFTSRMVLVCPACKAKLEAIAQEEEGLYAQQTGSIICPLRMYS